MACGALAGDSQLARVQGGSGMSGGKAGPHRTSARANEERYPRFEGGAECPTILDLLKVEGHLRVCPFCARQMEIAARRHAPGNRAQAGSWKRVARRVFPHAITAVAA